MKANGERDKVPSEAKNQNSCEQKPVDCFCRDGLQNENNVCVDDI